MSTWTSKALTVAAALALAACDAGLDVTRKAPAEVRLPDGLVIAGARGWCVDRNTSRFSEDAAVVVFGSCAAIAGNALLPRPPVPGVVTVSVEEPAEAAPTAEVLEAFLATEAGRAALARDGRAASVRIVETRRAKDALLLHAVDRSGWPRDTAEDYWRALFDIDGRFVTVSLVALADEPISRRDGIAALEETVVRLKAANAE